MTTSTQQQPWLYGYFYLLKFDPELMNLIKIPQILVFYYIFVLIHIKQEKVPNIFL